MACPETRMLQIPINHKKNNCEIVWLFFAPCTKKCTFAIRPRPLAQQLSIEYPPTFMEHIDNTHSNTNYLASEASTIPPEHHLPPPEPILESSDTNQLVSPQVEDNDLPIISGDKAAHCQPEDKENLPQSSEKQLNTRSDSRLEQPANSPENVEAHDFSHEKQLRSIQKQSQSKLTPPRKKLLDFSDISIRKLPKLSNQPSSSNQAQNWFLLDEDEEDEYYYQDDDDDEDQILAMEDDASNSEDSDDEQASDDSIPSDYDEDELERNIFFGYNKGKDYTKDPQEFIEHYEFERKVLEDQEIHIRNYQQINGVSVLPLDLQIEKEALNQSTLDFFNRNYLTYLELNGGKKAKKGPEGLSSAESTPTQELEGSQPQDQRKVEETTPSTKEKPRKKRVVFRQSINMKCFKEDEEVTQMSQKEEGLQEINHLQKQPITRRIIPMSQQLLRQTNLLMMKQPKPVSIPILQNSNGHNKQKVQVQSPNEDKPQDNIHKLASNKDQEIQPVDLKEEKRNLGESQRSAQDSQNTPQVRSLEQMVKQNAQKQQKLEMVIASEPPQVQIAPDLDPGADCQEEKVLRESEEQSETDQLQALERHQLLEPVQHVIEAQQQ